MNDADKALFDGLSILTDQEVNRVRAHLAAGLPVIGGTFGWPATGETATAGCLVAIAMSEPESSGRRLKQTDLLAVRFDIWSRRRGGREENGGQLTTTGRGRLAGLLDQEWHRRHPLPVAEEERQQGGEKDGEPERELVAASA